MKSDKNKFTFGFSAEFPGLKLKESLVSIAERPSLQLIEKENRDGSYTIETQAWTPLQTTFHADKAFQFQDIYNLLAAFYQFGSVLFTKEDPAAELDKIKSSLGSGQLTAYTHCKTPLERWEFLDLWPHSVNFGELCYSTSEEFDIEITWRFKNCKYTKLHN